MTTRTLTRAASLEALAALEAAMRLAFDDDDTDRERHVPVGEVLNRLVDELGIAPDGMDLDQDPTGGRSRSAPTSSSSRFGSACG
jgi:hypothetical protein